MDASDIIAIVAIVVGGIVALFTTFMSIRFSSRANRDTLMSVFYAETYKNYLMKRIPIAKDNISYSMLKSYLHGTEDLEQVLLDLRNDSLYFEFFNPDFYQELTMYLNSLDDLIVEKGESTMTYQEYLQFRRQIDKYILEMYQLINKTYLGIRK